MGLHLPVEAEEKKNWLDITDLSAVAQRRGYLLQEDPADEHVAKVEARFPTSVVTTIVHMAMVVSILPEV